MQVPWPPSGVHVRGSWCDIFGRPLSVDAAEVRGGGGGGGGGGGAGGGGGERERVVARCGGEEKVWVIYSAWGRKPRGEDVNYSGVLKRHDNSIDSEG